MSATRRRNQYLQEPLNPTFDHPQVTATTTWKVWKAPFACVIDAINYINPTGLAAHSSNNFKASVLVGAVSVATLFDTDSDDGASLAADTYVAGTMSVVAGATTLAAGDVLLLTATEEGTATLPAGRLEVHARRV